MIFSNRAKTSGHFHSQVLMKPDYCVRPWSRYSSQSSIGYAIFFIILEGVGVELESLAILCWFSEHYFFLTAHNAEYRSDYHIMVTFVTFWASKFHTNHYKNCAVVTLKKGNLSVSFYLPGDLTHQSRREGIRKNNYFIYSDNGETYEEIWPEMIMMMPRKVSVNGIWS